MTMLRILTMFLILLQAGLLQAQNRIEFGTVMGIQSVWAPGDDDIASRIQENNSAASSGFYGAYFGYEHWLGRRFARARLNACRGEVAYDLEHRQFSKGNGASSGYHNQQHHEVMMYGMQLGIEMPFVWKERTRMTFYWGPEVVVHQVLKSEGMYEEHRHYGYGQDSTGLTIFNGSWRIEEEVDSPSQESLSLFQVGMHLSCTATFALGSQYGFSTGLEGMLGLSNMISGPGKGSGLKVAARFNLGIVRAIGGQDLDPMPLRGE